jgi:UDP-N-acetylglucosamine 1-carboxyvinyltransferase
MSSFKVTGGTKLRGEIRPQGAKNEVLQILSAVLLSPEEITVNNIPDIVDVNKLIELLADLGVQVKKHSPSSYTFKADQVNIEYLLSEEFKIKGGALRGSIMIVGPLLARFGKGYIPKPGGDKIGRRRLDTHFIGFQRLGATFVYDRKEHFYKAEAKKLKGAYMLLSQELRISSWPL